MEEKEMLSQEYIMLFNGVSDAIQELQGMIDRMKFLQMRAEELVIEKK